MRKKLFSSPLSVCRDKKKIPPNWKRSSHQSRRAKPAAIRYFSTTPFSFCSETKGQSELRDGNSLSALMATIKGDVQRSWRLISEGARTRTSSLIANGKQVRSKGETNHVLSFSFINFIKSRRWFVLRLLEILRRLQVLLNFPNKTVEGKINFWFVRRWSARCLSASRVPLSGHGGIPPHYHPLDCFSLIIHFYCSFCWFFYGMCYFV